KKGASGEASFTACFQRGSLSGEEDQVLHELRRTCGPQDGGGSGSGAQGQRAHPPCRTKPHAVSRSARSRTVGVHATWSIARQCSMAFSSTPLVRSKPSQNTRPSGHCDSRAHIPTATHCDLASVAEWMIVRPHEAGPASVHQGAELLAITSAILLHRA